MSGIFASLLMVTSLLITVLGAPSPPKEGENLDFDTLADFLSEKCRKNVDVPSQTEEDKLAFGTLKYEQCFNACLAEEFTNAGQGEMAKLMNLNEAKCEKITELKVERI